MSNPRPVEPDPKTITVNGVEYRTWSLGRCRLAAVFTAKLHPGVWFVEGACTATFAEDGIRRPFHHCWNEDASGAVVDLTLEDVWTDPQYDEQTRWRDDPRPGHVIAAAPGTAP